MYLRENVLGARIESCHANLEALTNLFLEQARKGSPFLQLILKELKLAFNEKMVNAKQAEKISLRSNYQDYSFRKNCNDLKELFTEDSFEEENNSKDNSEEDEDPLQIEIVKDEVKDKNPSITNLRVVPKQEAEVA
ncbi:MAG: hypothetical protein WCO35_02105 [Candidatus Nomurabacteria bacterium]